MNKKIIIIIIGLLFLITGILAIFGYLADKDKEQENLAPVDPVPVEPVPVEPVPVDPGSSDEPTLPSTGAIIEFNNIII